MLHRSPTSKESIITGERHRLCCDKNFQALKIKTRLGTNLKTMESVNNDSVPVRRKYMQLATNDKEGVGVTRARRLS